MRQFVGEVTVKVSFQWILAFEVLGRGTGVRSSPRLTRVQASVGYSQKRGGRKERILFLVTVLAFVCLLTFAEHFPGHYLICQSPLKDSVVLTTSEEMRLEKLGV